MSDDDAELELALRFPILGGAFLMAGRASVLIKRALEEAGVEAGLVRRAALCAYEAEMNVVIYARSGSLSVEVDRRQVRIVAQDRGPGIADVDLAFTPGYSTASAKVRELGFGAGMGLPNIRTHADQVAVETVPGQGTRLVISFERTSKRDDSS